MSGTSLDGVDGVLSHITPAGQSRVLAHASAPFDPALRISLLSLNRSGPDELHRAALAGDALMRVYAQVVQSLLGSTGHQPAEIVAIGAHGQTVRHQPQHQPAYTLQLCAPALLAELTGIDVAADFRSRDVAAGGQGAPLVPAFHLGAFGLPGQCRAVLNLGGIANLSVLPGDGNALGWDCGPGNALLDHWCQMHLDAPFDRDGAWAAKGSVHAALLDSLLTEPYLQMSPPKSTGRDLFHAQWLQTHLNRHSASPVDVQATLTAFTARCCARDLLQHAPKAQTLIVCGGGALNHSLMHGLAQELPGLDVVGSQSHGLPPLQVEAAAFAWLAFKLVQRQPASLPSVTGARGARVLGALYPR